LLGWWDEVEVAAFLGDDELKTPEPDVGPGVRLTLLLAAKAVLIGWRRDVVAIPDPAYMVSP
jgi:hypothetical protein